MASVEKTLFEEKSSDRSSEDVQQLEDAGRRQSTSEEINELSNIEATAASKAAWLISVTVSLGGFLFGTSD
jgi:MFS transporter, SP family, solute carrier family 2 (myo-inositol transporter), member 13